MTKGHQDLTPSAQNYQVAYDYDPNDWLLREDRTGHAASVTLYGHAGANPGEVVGGYDDNGSLVEKTVTPAGGTANVDRYRYDLRERLSGYDADGDGSYDDNGDVTYGYDRSGARVSKAVVSGATTYYLVDANNPTGYAQVVEESATRSGAPATTYTVGLDVIGQADGAGAFSYLLYDGHGTTRMLADGSGNVAADDRYDYDAFGNHQFTTAAGTSLLYSGEQWDPALGMQYLRARYYDPSNGRFSSFDNFEGSPSHPASLHKYLYGASDPVQYADPSGQTFLSQLGGMFNSAWGFGAKAVNAYRTYDKVRTVVDAVAIVGLLTTSLLLPEHVGGAWVINLQLSKVPGRDWPDLEFAVTKNSQNEPMIQYRKNWKDGRKLRVAINPRDLTDMSISGGYNVNLFGEGDHKGELTFRTGIGSNSPSNDVVVLQMGFELTLPGTMGFINRFTKGIIDPSTTKFQVPIAEFSRIKGTWGFRPFGFGNPII